MAGTSVGKSLPRPCDGRKTLRRCQNNAATANVVFIDVDGDDVENVIVIDSPESYSKKLRGSTVRKDKQQQKRVIICIDDEESTEHKHPDTGVKKRRKFSSGASSSKGPSAAAKNHDKFLNEVTDDCEFVQENISSPVKISKCKRTYSGQARSRNRYGLSPESENDFSKDDFLDCELVEEDSSGSVREQWEKAFSKRKYESRNGQTGAVGCSKTSKASRNANHSGENVTSEQHKEPRVFSSLEKLSCQPGPSSTVGGDIPQDPSKTPTLADPVSKSVLNENGLYNEDNSGHGSDHLAENISMDCGDEYDHNLNNNDCNFPNAGPEGSSFSARHSAKEVDPAFESSQLREKSETMKENSSSPDAEPEGSSYSPRHSAKEVDSATESSQLREKSEAMKENSSRLSQEHREQASCNSKSENSNDQSGNSYHNVSLDAKNNVAEESDAEQPKKSSSFSDSGKSNYKRNISSVSSAMGNLSREPYLEREDFGRNLLKSVLKSTLNHLAEGSKTNCVDIDQQSFEHHNHRAENGGPVPKSVPLQEISDDLSGSAGRCMISDREKLKETDEYKKAMEEEWASRRRAVQIQAEEANQLRRLRKRENAERVRLLDMERRQKQRVEEIRETKKKDEEQMNMKDLIRAEIRNELSKVELTCSDMASFLRRLGIKVGNGLKPNADEVRAACKKALFAFHPDRAAKSDARQQVEAEEKFKLIIRMKEKFSVA